MTYRIARVATLLKRPPIPAAPPVRGPGRCTCPCHQATTLTDLTPRGRG